MSNGSSSTAASTTPLETGFLLPSGRSANLEGSTEKVSVMEQQIIAEIQELQRQLRQTPQLERAHRWLRRSWCSRGRCSCHRAGRSAL